MVIYKFTCININKY